MGRGNFKKKNLKLTSFILQSAISNRKRIILNNRLWDF